MTFDFKIIGNITDYTFTSFLETCENKKKLTILLHSAGDGTVSDQAKYQGKVEYFNKLYSAVLTKKLKPTNHMTYLTAKQALKENLIDKII